MENTMEKPNANESKWDPKDLSEACKVSLDEMIQSYWERPEWQTFDDFFSYKSELTKRVIYLLGYNWRHTLSVALLSQR